VSQKLASNSDRIQKLEGTLLGLAKSGDDNATIIFVREILGLVQDDMLPNIVNQSSFAEQTLVNMQRSFAACSSDMNNSLPTYPDWTTLSNSHKACRAQQSIMQSDVANLQTRNTSYDNLQNAFCSAFESKNVIPPYDECGYLMQGQNMRQYLVSLVNAFQKKYGDLEDLRQQCDDARFNASSTKSQLDLKVMQLSC